MIGRLILTTRLNSGVAHDEASSGFRIFVVDIDQTYLEAIRYRIKTFREDSALDPDLTVMNFSDGRGSYYAEDPENPGKPIGQPNEVRATEMRISGRYIWWTTMPKRFWSEISTEPVEQKKLEAS